MTKSCIIIGLGQIGMEYDYDHKGKTAIYTHAHAIDEHPEFKLVGAVDKSSNQRRRFEKRYDLPSFDDPELALQRLEPDLVVIATPTDLHSSILTKVINAKGPKLILCEKPLAYELDEAKNMIKMIKDAGIDLFVNNFRRVDHGVLEIKKRIENGEIKSPIKANVWYSKGIINNGSHFIDLLDLWLGEVKSTSIISQGRLWNNFDPEPDFKLEFNLGSAVFRSSWEESFSHYSIELLSPSGRLFYDYGGNHIEWQTMFDDPGFKGYKILDKQKEIIKNSMDIYQWHVYDNIHKYYTDKTTTLSTGFQAIKTLEVIDLIIKQRQKK